MAIEYNQVPNETNLKSQSFKTAEVGQPYQIPEAYTSAWSHWTVRTPRTARLTDGSTIAYRWYKFVDLPSLQHLNLTEAQKNILQDIAVKLHKAWSMNNSFMPLPVERNLVQMHNALLVKPPAGLEYGYVPIVIEQSK